MTSNKILLYWIIVRIAERVFTNDADVNSAFSVSSAHYGYAIVYSGATALLIYFFIQDRRRIRTNLFVNVQAGLYCYALLTALWSAESLVSAGQAIYSLYGLIFAGALCKYALEQGNARESARRLVMIWTNLLLIDYVVDVVFFVSSGIFSPPPIDEKALVAIAAFMINVAVGGRAKNPKSLALLWMFAAGQSFSAIMASTIIFARYLAGRVGKIISFMFIVFLGWAIYDVLRLVQAGLLSIYGKSWNYILSGSGRFRAWEYLYNEIAMFNWGDFFFGVGFMSERTFLSRQYLTWSIDAHSSILQSLYGVGVLGTSLMITLWVIPFMIPKRLWLQSSDARLWKTLLGCHTAFIVFGLTSSHYFSRPSVSAIFMTGILLLLHNLRQPAARTLMLPASVSTNCLQNAATNSGLVRAAGPR